MKKLRKNCQSDEWILEAILTSIKHKRYVKQKN